MGRRAIEVTSIDEEDALLGECPCGSGWLLVSEYVVPIAKRWYDALVLCCSTCGSSRRAIFDISSFFVPQSKAWVRAA